MESILYLTHRIPFPPNKGDKVRSFNLLRFLCKRYRVHLGTFVDDPADVAYIPELERMCASFKAITLRPAFARLRSAVGLWTGEALTLPYYRNAALTEWIDRVLRDHSISKAIVFSSAMANRQHLRPRRSPSSCVRARGCRARSRERFRDQGGGHPFLQARARVRAGSPLRAERRRHGLLRTGRHARESVRSG